jgi:hypothetical protein
MFLVVIIARFMLITMLALFLVIVVSIIMNGGPFAKLFIVSRVRGRMNWAVA